MHVEFTLEDGIVFVDYTDAVIDSDARFDEWSGLLIPGFERMLATVGSKFPLAVCVDGLKLQRRFGERYSRELAVRVAETYASAIARYGRSGHTTAVVAIEALQRMEDDLPGGRDERYAANVFRDRAEAIAFLRQITR